MALTGDYRLYYMCSTALWPQTVKREPRFPLHAEHEVDIDITILFCLAHFPTLTEQINNKCQPSSGNNFPNCYDFLSHVSS